MAVVVLHDYSTLINDLVLIGHEERGIIQGGGSDDTWPGCVDSSGNEDGAYTNVLADIACSSLKSC